MNFRNEGWMFVVHVISVMFWIYFGKKLNGMNEKHVLNVVVLMS